MCDDKLPRSPTAITVSHLALYLRSIPGTSFLEGYVCVCVMSCDAQLILKVSPPLHLSRPFQSAAIIFTLAYLVTVFFLFFTEKVTTTRQGLGVTRFAHCKSYPGRTSRKSTNNIAFFFYFLSFFLSFLPSFLPSFY
jgi:hypothetical protein